MDTEQLSEKDKKIALLLSDLTSLESYINDIFTFAPLPLCFVSPSGVILESNPSFEKFSGFAFNEIIGKAIEDFFNGDDLKKIFKETEKTGFFKEEEVEFFPKKEERLIVQVFSRARKDEKGNFLGYFLGLSDLTAIKRKNIESRRALMNILEDVKEARQRAEEEKNKTLAIIYNFTDGILVVDNKNNFSLINPSAEQLLGVKKEEMIGRPFSKVVYLQPFIKFLSQKKIFNQEFETKEDLVLETIMVPLAREGERIGTLIILHNITREKLVEKMKSDFVSLAAHQLRTPLSAVKWILRMLLDGELGELKKEQRNFLEDGYISNQRMIDLVNDLLNVARIEEGRYIYDLTSTDIEKLIKPIIKSRKEECRERKIAVTFKKSGKKPSDVLIDSEKIAIVFDNILDNAISYTFPGGRVAVSLSYAKEQVRVCVKDSGMGIPGNQQKNVFKKFFRGANVVRKETDGTGLGLFISKNIVEAHKGKIWFKSEEGKGTNFCFTIPTKKSKI